MDRNEFIQPSVTTRVFEKSLLTKSDFERLIEAVDINDALRILQETKYKEEVAKLSKAKDFEEVLDKMTINFYKDMYSMTRDKNVVDLLALKYFYHNIKILVKENILSESLENLYYDIGDFPVDELRKNLDNSGNENFATIAKEAIEEYEKYKNPQDADIYIDKKYFEKLKEIAEELKVDLFKVYVRDLIDFTNISTVIRSKGQDRSIEFLKKILIPGGNLDVNSLENLFNIEIDENISLFKSTGFYKYLRKGLEEYKQSGSMAEFEKQKDNYFMELVKESKKVTYGPEVLFAYLYAREIEIKNIRIILISKLNSTDPTSIRERLRDIYV